MEQDVNMKTTAIAIQTSEKASRAFLLAAEKFISRSKYASHSSNTSKTSSTTKPKGKQVEVHELTKDGAEVQFMDVKAEEMKGFQKFARKYNITYAMKKDESTSPPTFYIYFKAKDGVVVEKALSEFLAEHYRKNEKGFLNGVAAKLKKAKEKAKNQPDTVKNKELVR